MSTMPSPISPAGAKVVQVVWDLFYATARWPTVGSVARQLDRRHNLMLEEALPDVPSELVNGIDPLSGVSDSQTVRLTVAGGAAATGSHEELDTFVAAVRLAAELDRAWDPAPGNPDAQPKLAPEDLVRALPLPAAGRQPLLARAGAMLRNENWGWTTAGGDAGSSDWTFSVSRQVRRFRDVADSVDYWSRAHPAVAGCAPEAAGGLPTEFTDEAALEAPLPAQFQAPTIARTVFLVHGRDADAKNALVELLRAFDLRVVSWRDAATAAGGGTPYTGDIVRAGMETADAVVVLLTPDDIGYVRRTFRQERDGLDELQPTGQARLNVVFEAGMAMMRDRTRVVLVEIGATRSLSDTAGLNVIRLHDDVETRKDLAARLRAAGLAVDTENETWRIAGQFDRAPLTPSQLSLPSGDGAGAPTDAEANVLRHLAAHFDQLDANRLETPFDVPGLEWPRVAVALRDLYRSNPPYIEGVPVAQEEYPVIITGLTERGRRSARGS